MLRACVQRFDVTGNLEKFCKILGTKQHLTQSKHKFFLCLFLLNIVVLYTPCVLKKMQFSFFNESNSLKFNENFIKILTFDTKQV